MTFAAVALLVVAAGLFFLLRKRSKWEKGPFVPYYGRNLSEGATVVPGGIWTVQVPATPGSDFHAMILKNPPAIGDTITVRLRVEGEFRPTEHPNGEAVVSVMIQRKGDDWTGENGMEHYRWYSPSTPLREGDMVLTLPVTGWDNVWHDQNEAAFQAALRDVGNIAIVFGDERGRAHGIHGEGTITLMEYRTNV